MEISAHSYNKSGNTTVNSNVILGYTQEQKEADLKIYLFQGLVFLVN